MDTLFFKHFIIPGNSVSEDRATAVLKENNHLKSMKMKKVIFAIAIMLGLTASVIAQTPSPKMKSDKVKTEMKMKMKDGVMMMDNKMMVCKEGKIMPMKETYTFTDGSKISPKGVMTMSDGKTMKLKNGHEVDKSGKMAMIHHGDKGHVCGPDCPMNKKM